jgi:hypothetical protein
MANLGGYREGSGRSKSGYYKGIYCGSTYELCWVIYALDNGIEFDRFKGILRDNNLSYVPDFLLKDGKTIIELKGYELKESVNKKTQLAESLGYTVIVLRKNDLKDVFSYAEQKYKTKKFYTLYDEYKPIYEYQCAQCGSKILRDKQCKKSIAVCSRKCSMLHNRLVQVSSRIGTPNQRAKEFYNKHRDRVLARRRELYLEKKLAS